MLQCATQPAMVGETEMRLTLLHRLGGKLIAISRAVEQRVGIVDVQMSGELDHDQGVQCIGSPQTPFRPPSTAGRRERCRPRRGRTWPRRGVLPCLQVVHMLVTGLQLARCLLGVHLEDRLGGQQRHPAAFDTLLDKHRVGVDLDQHVGCLDHVQGCLLALQRQVDVLARGIHVAIAHVHDDDTRFVPVDRIRHQLVIFWYAFAQIQK
jgi:hypothetical protein